LFVWGYFSVKENPIDAIPELSENQVIVFTEWMGVVLRLWKIKSRILWSAIFNIKNKKYTCCFDVWDEFRICHL
jgi:hypothetical protein